MKKILFAALLSAMPAMLTAQSAVDAYTLSQSDTRGTARFMSMGGAFTALGGDLSTLTQNPAGIGVYRRSEIGVTLDISPSKFTTIGTEKIGETQTKVACNNFGYVGSIHLPGALRTFNWGASYNRAASFNRVFSAYNNPTQTSLSNYIAAYTTAPEADLNFDDGYNPYLDSDLDWLSILGYNTYMINPTADGGYQGLFQDGTHGDAGTIYRESGYVDEYAIDFGGNVSDVVYWGIGFGITDMDYKLYSDYSESMSGARIASEQGMATGNAEFDLQNWRHISGSGWNFKAGVIVRPINELRLGFAVHTPTWYSLTNSGVGTLAYKYSNIGAPLSDRNPLQGDEETDETYYNFRLKSPWRMMVGAAAVIGSQAIVSLDYERQAYGDMSVQYENGWGEYLTDEYVRQDIKDYFKATDIIRLGVEYRVTPAFSLRAGYSYATTNVKEEANDGTLEIITSQGPSPSYVFNKDTYSISFGLGYRYQAFYIDGAYVYRNRKSTYHAFTDFDGHAAPTADLTQSTNSVVLSCGFKF